MIIENGKLVKVSDEDIKSGKLVIPSGVKVIGKDSVAGLNLTEVEIPEGVTEIEDSAFFGCGKLSTVTFPSTVKKLGEDVFTRCDGLKSVSLNEGLESIDSSAFSSCTNLTDIVIPDTVTSTGINLFSGCTRLRSAVLSKNMTSVSFGTFCDCHSLKSIIIPDSVKTIEGSAFANCYDLRKVICPEGLKSIEQRAFYSCKTMDEFNFPSTLESLGESSFELCTYLTSVELPDGIVIIPKNAFSSCAGIEKLVLPKGLKMIEPYAFNNCQHLLSLEIPQGTQEVKDHAFMHCHALESVKIPSSLSTISIGVFDDCTNLKNVTIEDGAAVYIESYAFAYCKALEEINLPESNVFIGENAFLNCSSLSKFKIPEKVSNINRGTFENCGSLSEIDLGNIKTIGQSAFNTCKSLKTVRLPKTLISIDKSAFNNSGLEEMEIGAQIEKVGEAAFSNCSKLRTVRILCDMSELPNEIFSCCSMLENVTLPETITKIGKKSFMNCSALGKLQLPKNVREIDEEAFADCENLSNVEMSDSVRIIRNMAFKNCSKLDKLKLPNGLNQLEQLGNSYMFFEKNEDGFTISKGPGEATIPTSLIFISLPLLSQNWDNHSLLFTEQKNEKLLDFYNTFLTTLSPEQQKEFVSSHNFTFFKQLKLPTGEDTAKYDLYKVLYNLGAFSKPVSVGNKTVDYAQKVVGFILEKISKEELDLESFGKIFRDMNPNGLKPEFTDFFLSQFSGLMAEEQRNHGFISKCYNDFETVQKTNTSNHGSQRQLKATLQKFQDYFLENKFNGVTDETLKIAKSISPYTAEQEDFDRSVSMFEEKSTQNIPDHIAGEPITEKQIFSGIDSYADAIQKASEQTTFTLTDIAQTQFTFEWLSKNDPDNLILGKLCNCCAHIKSAGYGIVHTSISHPDVQTLVFRDRNGIIVGKSTIFVNPKEGYAVFNNVELSTTLSELDKREIYEKFMIATEEFIARYNKNHPESIIKQTNIGLGRNKLKLYFERYNGKTPNLLKAIDYSEYGIEGQKYPGDSSLDQAVVWSEDRAGNNENQKQ